MTFFYFVNLQVNRLANNTIIACFYWNAFIIHRFCMFAYGKLFAVANFLDCYSPKFDVSFQISVCWHAENCLMRISLQANLCFIMHDAFEIICERHFIFALMLLSN